MPAQFYEDGYEACLGDVIRVLRGDAPREWLGPTPEAQPDHRTLIGSGPRAGDFLEGELRPAWERDTDA